MHVVVAALALSALVSAAPGDDGVRAPPSVTLAQAADRLEEDDFGDPPPPPPLPEEGADPADPVGDAPPLPPPSLDPEGEAPPAAPAPPRREARQAPSDDEPMSPFLVRTLQYASGLGTVAACSTVGCVGAVCGSSCLVVPLQPFALSLPLLYPLVVTGLIVGVGAGSGAAGGAVEGLVGDALGDEEGGLLWPTLAAAGTGAALMAGVTGATLASQMAINLPAGQLNPLSPRLDTPLACLLGTSACALAGLYCVGTPLAGLLAYGLVATPEAPAAEEASRSSAPAPRLADRAGAVATMAF